LGITTEDFDLIDQILSRYADLSDTRGKNGSTMGQYIIIYRLKESL
jgi:hypothetical protein